MSFVQTVQAAIVGLIGCLPAHPHMKLHTPWPFYTTACIDARNAEGRPPD